MNLKRIRSLGSTLAIALLGACSDKAEDMGGKFPPPPRTLTGHYEQFYFGADRPPPPDEPIYNHAPFIAQPGRQNVPQPAGAKPAQDAASWNAAVADQPRSTFNIRESRASYAFVREHVRGGVMPTAYSVNVAEMLNYFPYQYASPSKADGPIGVTTWLTPSPWNQNNQLLHIAVQGAKVHARVRPKLNLVILVNVAEHPGAGNRLDLVKSALVSLAERLRDDDHLAIMTYVKGLPVSPDVSSGRSKRRIIDAIDNLGASGGKSDPGLRRAYALARKHASSTSVNRVILVTDDDLGNSFTAASGIDKLIAAQRKAGIYLSALDIDEHSFSGLLQWAAHAGNGNAAFIDTPAEAERALAVEIESSMFPIATQVKVQVDFSPATVARYRLIGYDMRVPGFRMKGEQQDVAEMGSGHRTTALYEVTPAIASPRSAAEVRPISGVRLLPGLDGALCTVQISYQVPGAHEPRILKHPVHASSAYRTLDTVPEDQRFAAAVAAFGGRLRRDDELVHMSYEQIASLANSAIGSDPGGYRAEFVGLVRQAAKLDRAARNRAPGTHSPQQRAP